MALSVASQGRGAQCARFRKKIMIDQPTDKMQAGLMNLLNQRSFVEGTSSIKSHSGGIRPPPLPGQPHRQETEIPSRFEARE